MSAVVSQSDELPDPPRWRWLRRSVLFTLLVLGLLALSRWLWGVRMEKQVAATVADLRARGEPALPEDLQKPPFQMSPAPSPDLYGQAMTAHVYTAADQQWDGVTNWESAPTDADVAAMQRIDAENGAADALVRQARLSHAGLVANMATFNFARHLARMIAFSAMAEHYAGDDAEAVELLRDDLAMAKAMDERSSSLIGFLVAEGLSAIACDTAGRLAEALTIKGSDARLSPGRVPTGAIDTRTRQTLSQPLKPATPEQVRALIDDLLDEQAFALGIHRGLQFENVEILSRNDPVSYATQSRQSERMVRLLWPMILREQLEDVEEVRLCEDALAQKRFASSQLMTRKGRKAYGEIPASPFLKDGVLPSSHYFSATYSGILKSSFRGSTVRHATAVLLAVHLYEMDHQLRLPASLSELAPRYLPQLPADPFRNDANTFGYNPTVRSPFIYTVGEDGIDDGGSVTPPAQYPGFGQSIWRTPDEAFYIRWVAP